VADALAAYTEVMRWLPEDLEVLHYIGPKREAALTNAGVVTLAQLADLTPLQRAEIHGAGISPAWLERWADDAREALRVRHANSTE
jgi:predicted flap endonuclease-1-like 5' DNA nuclease